MLKADLHLHTSEDPNDHLPYNARELIDYAKTLGFDVLAITLHEKLFQDKKVFDYARKKGILLIPGIELKINGMHVLAYNVTETDIKDIKNLEDLKKIKRKNTLIVAPHPYYGLISLGKNLEKYVDLFDAVEYCHFYTKWINGPNKKAARVAWKHNKPLVGNSDAHHLWRLNTTYTLIDSKKDLNAVINAVKKGNVKVVSTHLTLFRYLRAAIGTISSGIKSKVSKQKK